MLYDAAMFVITEMDSRWAVRHACFSRQAMEHGEIIHDYNYAQVITLNLVRKGFRVQEVPITYKVRKQVSLSYRFVSI